MEPPWSLIDGGRFPGLSAVSVRDKAKLGSRGVYLISIYTLAAWLVWPRTITGVIPLISRYGLGPSSDTGGGGRPRNRLTTRLDKTFYMLVLGAFQRRFIPEDTWIYLHLIWKYAWMFIFSSQTRLVEAWLVAGWRAAQIISGTNDPNAALILSLIYLPRPASSQPRPRAGCPLY